MSRIWVEQLQPRVNVSLSVSLWTFVTAGVQGRSSVMNIPCSANGRPQTTNCEKVREKKRKVEREEGRGKGIGKVNVEEKGKGKNVQSGSSPSSPLARKDLHHPSSPITLCILSINGQDLPPSSPSMERIRIKECGLVSNVCGPLKLGELGTVQPSVFNRQESLLEILGEQNQGSFNGTW